MTHRTAALITLAGGVVMAIGSFMPWLTARSAFGSVSTAGTDGDGVFTLIVGAVVALGAVVYLERDIPGLGRGLMVTAGLGGIGVAILDFTEASRRVSDIGTNLVAASVGPGLYILFLGSCAVVFGSWRLHPANRNAPPE